MTDERQAVLSDRVWTIPNLVSFTRLLGVPLFLWLVLGPEEDELALLVLMASGVTDYLDGVLARKLNQSSKVGQILDPVADRLYILAVVAGLALRDIIPGALAISLPLRDVALFALIPFLRTRGFSSLPVHFLGKAATAALLYAFPLLLLGDGSGTFAALAKAFGWSFAIWGTALYWWAGLLYVWQVRTLLRTRPPIAAPSVSAVAAPVGSPNRADQDRADQDRADQDRADQDRADQDRVANAAAGPSRPPTAPTP